MPIVWVFSCIGFFAATVFSVADYSSRSDAEIVELVASMNRTPRHDCSEETLSAAYRRYEALRRDGFTRWVTTTHPRIIGFDGETTTWLRPDSDEWAALSIQPLLFSREYAWVCFAKGKE